MTEHPLGPATDHRLGKLLSHQLANQTRAPPRVDSFFCSSAYEILAVISSCCSTPKVVDALGKFTEKIEAILEMIAKRIGYEEDMSASRKKVYASLDSMSWLSVEDKLIAASSITSIDKNLDLFFSIPDNEKEKMVNMILNGRI
ncbi:hypothetical protein ACH5RR_013313 [Cinchona calisaya]|uniref:Uncharacterized protein n=1 Tax=Cinchona calisaya TaxID=153742 RepID=A0ABD2ZZP7_9GENT